MNKGILKLNGEYCLFLNSRDYLISPETIANLLEKIDSTISSDIYYPNRNDSNDNVFIFLKRY